ncbi:hypothetical protein ACP70R_011944 [Stipagrostis hirtigluma subsp. patula]
MAAQVVHHVLRGLPAWSVAAARSIVRNGRRNIVDGDARTLLLLHRRLLSQSVHGIFINYIDYPRAHLFARPSPASSTGARVDGMLGFLPGALTDWWSVLDHCGGLVLCDMEERGLCVCNPATRQWTVVPPSTMAYRDCAGTYLVFDPALSPHYEVFKLPQIPEKPRSSSFRTDHPPFVGQDSESNDDDLRRLMEWPPKLWRLNVFSSSTGQWHERVFVREGGPVGTHQDMLLDPREPNFCGPRQRYAVYWQGALYVQCRGFFVSRFSLSDGKYKVIKSPADNEKSNHGKPYLGRSTKGVYFGMVKDCHLRVWILYESHGHMDWILMCQDDLTQYSQHVARYGRMMDAPWTVHDVHDTTETLPNDGLDWDSDNDGFFIVKDGAEEYGLPYFEILGFDPFKEVVFLTGLFEVVAYHLDSSKVQYLGNSRPNSYHYSIANGIYESFVYTPSMIGELNEGGTDGRSS